MTARASKPNFEEDEKMKNICDVKPMPEKMNVMKMTVEDFGRVPYRTKDTDFSEFYSLVILPTEEIHDSGYKCMDFVAIDKDGYPICRLSGCSDVLHLDGIGGYGEYKGKLNNMVVPKGWSIDCLPCGLIRVFSRYMLKPDDMAVSSYCVYSNENWSVERTKKREIETAGFIQEN